MFAALLSIFISIPAIAEIAVESFTPFDQKICVDNLGERKKKQLERWGWEENQPIAKIETLKFDNGYICRFDLKSDEIHKIAVAFLKDGAEEFRELHVSHPFSDSDCGAKIEVADVHVINIGSESAAKSVLFVETGNEVIGCCGTANRSKTKLTAIDPSTGVKLKEFDLSDSCVADKECDGKCTKRGKKRSDTGIQGKVLWTLCNPACEHLEIERRDLAGKKKLASIILLLDSSGKILSQEQ